MTPAAKRSRSVRLVLPASTCAKIPKFSAVTERHVLWIGENSFSVGHERSAHLSAPWVESMAAGITAGHRGRSNSFSAHGTAADGGPHGDGPPETPQAP